ncbi:hypothetical protein [Caballeronia sp. AZ7_KS35]|uniref:hypothetical protein n=1 Tax=Caballeronia sp. AZ7_KS35 TaxID=2921762 RepID=UPI00202920FD|nr:hypothetical protein [Caballeronia sp. AZ7_KS35]
MTKDEKQLIEWLLRDPNTNERLEFAGPPEPQGFLTRVKMRSIEGDEWTLVAGFREGWLTPQERLANLRKAMAEEKEEVVNEEPTLFMLREMAYELKLVPRGETVPMQFMQVLREQYKAAMRVQFMAGDQHD